MAKGTDRTKQRENLRRWRRANPDYHRKYMQKFRAEGNAAQRKMRKDYRTPEAVRRILREALLPIAGRQAHSQRIGLVQPISFIAGATCSLAKSSKRQSGSGSSSERRQ